MRVVFFHSFILYSILFVPIVSYRPVLYLAATAAEAAVDAAAAAAVVEDDVL